MKVILTKERILIYKRNYQKSLFRIDLRFMCERYGSRLYVFYSKRSIEITKKLKVKIYNENDYF